jgi:ABC-2 type transport system ATP-binding protein
VRRTVVALLLVGSAYGLVLGLAVWRGTRPGPIPPDVGASVTAPSSVPVVPGARTELLTLVVPTGPDDATPIGLDVALSIPEDVDVTRPAPAVVLLHGFASDRTSQLARAADLVEDGYVVAMPSARGAGDSAGTIALADRRREGRDLVALVDLLAARDEVRRDAPGDPRVALVGVSYGGGSALIAAGLDARVDAVVAITAWHDLAEALAPNAAGAAGTGPLKVGWTSLLFTARTLSGEEAAPVERCGRFAVDVCALADRAAISGTLDAEGRAVLTRASLAGRLSSSAATLLVHGRGDTLFPVEQALANARELHRSGAPVRIRLVAGEHGPVGRAATDGPLAVEVDAWLARWLLDVTTDDALAADGVLVHDAEGGLTVEPWPPPADGRSLTLRLTEGRRLTSRVEGDTAQGAGRVGPAVLVAPAGGLPASLTVLPGLGDLGGFGDLASLVGGADVPGQFLAVESAPLARSALLSGPPTLALDVAAETGELQLFVRLSEVVPGGRATIIGSLVAPLRVSGVSRDIDAPTRVDVTMPSVVHRLAAGSRLRLTVSTTDQAFANLRLPGLVELEPSTLALTLRGSDLDAALTEGSTAVGPVRRGGLRDVWQAAPLVLIVLAAVLAVIGGAVAIGLRRDARRPPLAPVAERLAASAAGAPPIVIRGLVKDYDDGTRAVDGLDLTVRAGQVVGLLGPNGAGKTTTLRMLLGLIAPTSGSIEVFGQPMRPGHRVLERIGALVEGPGLVPDLSGRDNLVLHWRGGGRPLAEADLDWALSIADLGAAIDRPVRTYSHGMAQRLGIAQALLGRPELLVLDEPTDGLDPEQIRAMRRLLVRLGAEGHTVLVSSHLLAEVEQTCTHAVVVLGGRVVAAGPVSEIGERARTLVVEVDDRRRAQLLLAEMLGTERVALEGSGIVVSLDDPGRAADVVAMLVGAGLRVHAASPRGRLEDAFLQLTGVVRPDVPPIVPLVTAAEVER